MKKQRMIRVIGCPHGMDQEEPSLPQKPCQHPCQWRIRHTESHHCMWKMVYQNDLHETSFTLRETGDMIGITHESIRHIEMRAMRKMKERLAYLESGVSIDVFLRHDLSIRFISIETERRWRKEFDQHLPEWFREEESDDSE